MSYLVLDPRFTIVGTTEEYLRATLTERAALLGCSMCDAFPDNPADNSANGVGMLRSSLEAVMSGLNHHRMGVQRYDIQDRTAPEGGCVERYWVPVNSPVLASGSTEITHIIHDVEDVTDAIRARELVEREAILVDQQGATLTLMHRDLLRRKQAIRETRRELCSMLRQHALRPPCDSQPVLTPVSGYPPALKPGQRAALTGIYQPFHPDTCERPVTRVFIAKGHRFSRCPDCKDAVLYRPAKALDQ